MLIGAAARHLSSVAWSVFAQLASDRLDSLADAKAVSVSLPLAHCIYQDTSPQPVETHSQEHQALLWRDESATYPPEQVEDCTLGLPEFFDVATALAHDDPTHGWHSRGHFDHPNQSDVLAHPRVDCSFRQSLHTLEFRSPSDERRMHDGLERSAAVVAGAHVLVTTMTTASGCAAAVHDGEDLD